MSRSSWQRVIAWLALSASLGAGFWPSWHSAGLIGLAVGLTGLALINYRHWLLVLPYGIVPWLAFASRAGQLLPDWPPLLRLIILLAGWGLATAVVAAGLTRLVQPTTTSGPTS